MFHPDGKIAVVAVRVILIQSRFSGEYCFKDL